MARATRAKAAMATKMKEACILVSVKSKARDNSTIGNEWSLWKECLLLKESVEERVF